MLMRQFIILRQNRRKSTSEQKMHLPSVGRHTKNHYKTALVWIGILAVALPIFRSGLRSNLTFFEFVKLHTIFGPEPEYIPKELYSEIEVWE